jgi:hypothetical protein
VSRPSPWPNLFVAGAAKAGTTSLWRYLDEHPEIFMARVKEPHFFSRYSPPIYPVVHDEAAYLRLFAGARTPLRGEASPSYLWSELAPERIKRASPEAKIVIAVRDPVERLYSLYWQRVRVGLARVSFDDFVARGLEDDPGADDSMYRRSRYTAGVRRFLDLFGDDVRVVVFEELTRDVPGELARLFAVLGVDPAVAGRIRPERHNPFALPRGRLAAALLHSERTRRAARRVVPSRFRPRIEERLLAARPKPPLDAETNRRLTELFRDDVRDLQALLGRRLPWDRWAESYGPAETEIRTVEPRTRTAPGSGR